MIALVDCNNFYASCERVFRPDLNGKPIVVLSNNDGCVIARSAEAKKMGIPMGAPAFKYENDFRRQGVHVFSSNYALYGDMSSRVMNILGDMAPGIEVYSIDECFLDLSGIPLKDLPALAAEMKERVFKWTGIPISLGIAPTKSLAKVANKYAKKHPKECKGVYIIGEETTRVHALKWLPLEDVWGIGRQQHKKLSNLGIKNAYQLSLLDETYVKKKYTVVGLRLVKELKGIQSVEWEFEPPKKKATAVTRSFEKALFDLPPLLENISIYASVCGEKLRKEGSDCLMLQVFLRTSRFKDPLEQRYAQHVVRLPFPTNSSIELARYAQAVMKHLYKPGFPYAKAGVVAMMLTPTENRQSNIFQNEDPRHKAIMAAMDKHNSRDMRDVIRLASNGTGRRWRMKQNLLSPRYTTRLSDIITIKSK